MERPDEAGHRSDLNLSDLKVFYQSIDDVELAVASHALRGAALRYFRHAEPLGCFLRDHGKARPRIHNEDGSAPVDAQLHVGPAISSQLERDLDDLRAAQLMHFQTCQATIKR